MKEVDMRSARITRILFVTFALGSSRLATALDPDNQQGTHLQNVSVPGTPDYDSFYIDSTSQNISAPKGELSAAPGAKFKATVIKKNSPPQTVNVRLVQAFKHDNVYRGNPAFAKHEYQIVYDDNTPLCSNKNNRALAIPGSYYPGLYSPQANKVSFACIPESVSAGPGLRGGGVAAKCVDWGYPPWFLDTLPWIGKTPQKKKLPKSPHTAEKTAQDLHQACLSMGTADYCGNGQPHTVDGTWIAMFNLVTAGKKGKKSMVDSGYMKSTYQSQHPFSVDYRFEAAWRPLVLDPADNTYAPGGAVCLTKARWATMGPELTKTCPRLNGHEFCDTESEAQLEDPDYALLFSYSLFLDIGLYRCVNASTTPNLWVTTIVDDLQPASGSSLPPITYNFKEATSFQCMNDSIFEGTVLRLGAEGAPLPEDFPIDWTGQQRPKPVPLYRHTIGLGQYKTDTVDQAIGATKTVPIGYILPAQVCPGRFCGNPLKLYEHNYGKHTEYLTTAKSPPAPFGKDPILLGYVIDLLQK
jgi:hypothetical protein